MQETIDLSTLRVVIAAADLGSISAASERLQLAVGHPAGREAEGLALGVEHVFAAIQVLEPQRLGRQCRGHDACHEQSAEDGAQQGPAEHGRNPLCRGMRLRLVAQALVQAAFGR